MKIYRLFAALVAVIMISGLSSCERPEINKEQTPVKLVPELKFKDASVKALSSEGTYNLPFTLTNPVEGEEVKAVSSADWLSVLVGTNELVLDVQANPADERTADITVSYPELKDIVISVVQAAAGVDIVLSSNAEDISHEGAQITITVTSDRDWMLEGSSEWVKPSVTSGKTGDQVVFEVLANTAKDSRTASFLFMCGTNSAELKFTQSGFEIASEIKDKVLKEYILKNVDANADGSISSEEANALKVIDLKFDAEKFNTVESLDGLKYFTALEKISLVGEGFVEADFSTMPELRELVLSQSKFMSVLNISGCSKLQRLDLSSCTELAELDLTQSPELTYVNFFGTKVSKVDLSKCTKLDTFVAYSSKLTSLDFTANASLTTVMASGNPLESVTFPESINLESLTIGSESLLSIDLNPCKKLRKLDVSHSPMKSLDLSSCPELETLSIQFCKRMTTLDISKNYVLGKIDAYLSNISKLTVFEGQWDVIKDKCFGISSTVALNTVPIAYPEDCAALITDAGLKNYVVSNYDADGNGKISGTEAQTVKEIVYVGKSLTSFDNFVFFRNIAKLDLSNNNLTKLNIAPFAHSLTDLNLSNNKFEELYVAGAVKLQNINVSHNSLKSIDGLGSSMPHLLSVDASHNNLSTFKCAYNSSVKEINVSHNVLTVCDLEYDKALESLDVSHNKLTEETYAFVRPYTWENLKNIDVSYNDFVIFRSDRTWTDVWTSLLIFKSEGCAKLKMLDLSPNTNLREIYIKSCPKLATVQIGASANPMIFKDETTTIERK